jgi:hypothetical protein
MRLKEEFITHDADGESLLVPTGAAGWAGLVRGNRTFGVILELRGQETTEEAVVAAMRQRFDAPERAIERDVARVLDELRQIGALDE